jgi:hypothetical protein
MPHNIHYPKPPPPKPPKASAVRPASPNPSGIPLAAKPTRAAPRPPDTERDYHHPKLQCCPKPPPPERPQSEITTRERYGRIAFLWYSQDHLQLPPVPELSSMLAQLEGTSDEHKVMSTPCASNESPTSSSAVQPNSQHPSELPLAANAHNKTLVRSDATQAITRERLQNDECVKLSSGRLPYEYYVVVANALDEGTSFDKRILVPLDKESSYLDLYKSVRDSMNLQASTGLLLMLKADDEQCVLPCHSGSCTKRLNRRTLLSVRTAGPIRIGNYNDSPQARRARDISQKQMEPRLSKRILELKMRTDRGRWIAEWVAADWNNWYRLNAADQNLWVEYEAQMAELRAQKHKMAELRAQKQRKFPGAAESLAPEL